MGKYGKKFRKVQNAEWKEKYFNYKLYKQKIKSLINEKNKEPFISKNNNEKENAISQWTFQFEETLDKDIKKIYIFFSNRERTLYQKINKLLHVKPEYPNFEVGDFLNQYNEINDLSLFSLKISNFIYYNLKAIIKILKKYDKKVIGPDFKNLQIKINYIQAKLEEQNSDILYLIKFKMIDEINLIIEDLIKNLREEFKLNKNKINFNPDNDLDIDNKLIEEITEETQAESFIKQKHNTIKNNIKKIDLISSKVSSLFIPWKDFLRISSDINSKLLQINKENGLNESMNLLVKKSIVESISFSKENKYNVIIILFHGFLYMFSFSIIIPFYIQIFIKKMNIQNIKYIYCGLLMMMTSIGSLFTNIYESFFFKKSTKKPIIISSIGLIIGNLTFFFASYFGYWFLLYISRFLIGLFNLRTHNKMYLFNFLLKRDISFNLTMFHTFSMIGLSAGFLINASLLNIDLKNQIFDAFTIGPFIAACLSFILFILTIILFTEAHSKYFNMTTLQNLDDGIISENTENNDNNQDITKKSTFSSENIENEVRTQSLLLKDINDQLGNFNKQGNFDDTNLVTKSINELTKKEEGSLDNLFNAFITYLFLIFTTKFINESIYINSFILIQDENVKFVPLFLGSSCALSLLIELSLSCKNVCITENILLIILLFLLCINNGLFILFHYLNITINIFFNYHSFLIGNILANLTEKYAAHLFMYIIPENYHLCKIHGNILINIFSMLSRIISCSLLFIYDIKKEIQIYITIIFIIMTSLSFLSLLLYLIFYQDIRVKAISRIMKKISKDEPIIPSEI